MNETKIVNFLLSMLIALSLVMLSWTAFYLTGLVHFENHQTSVAAISI